MSGRSPLEERADERTPVAYAPGSCGWYCMGPERPRGNRFGRAAGCLPPPGAPDRVSAAGSPRDVSTQPRPQRLRTRHATPTHGRTGGPAAMVVLPPGEVGL